MKRAYKYLYLCGLLPLLLLSLPEQGLTQIEFGIGIIKYRGGDWYACQTAVTNFLSYLNDPSLQVRRRVASALKKAPDPSFVPYMINAIYKNPKLVQGSLFFALRAFGTPAVEQLRPILNDENKNIRDGALYTLVEMKDPKAAESLIALLIDDDEKIQKSARNGLKKIGDPAAKYMIRALKDSNVKIRRAVADVFRLTKQKSAVEALIVAVTKDSDWQVRRNAAYALGKIGDYKAVDTLIDALIDEVGADKAKFLDYYKVSSVDDLPVTKYLSAIKALEAKR